ncbi:MAG: chromate transporter [Chloroflexota bacterium]|nr:MAG: chromate transporter [Chloroflexota bacterium]
MGLLNLALLIFVFNVLTFGNGPIMIPLLQKSLVDEQGVLTVDQLLYAFTIARVTPGQANVYVASIGYMLYGIVGAILTTIVIQLPGYAMLPLLKGYERLGATRAVRGFTRGLTSTSVGLIFAATLGIARTSLTGWISWLVFALTFVLTYVLKRNAILSLVIASAVGLALTLWL